MTSGSQNFGRSVEAFRPPTTQLDDRIMILSHKIQLKPTVKQEEYFRRAAGVARFTWNWGLTEWNKAYAEGEKTSGYKLKKRLNSIKREEFPWMYEVHRGCSMVPFMNLQKAFQGYFRRLKNPRIKRERRKDGELKGHPKFHKKGMKDSFYAGCGSERGFHVKEERVCIPRLGWIKMTETLRFTGKITTAVVFRTADRWFISISVETELPEYRRTPEQKKVIGVDLGVKHATVLSDGRKFDGPKPLKAALKRLKRKQRQLSRKEKGSSNYRKAAAKVAKLHWRIANQRKDFLHKLTTGLCREAETIVIEDLNVSGMLKNHKLARALSDIGLYEFRRQLEYKDQVFGTRLVIADRWFPSTKRCSSCGAVKKLMRLSERTYVCEACGTVEDRDVNAGKNLEQLGWVPPEVTPGDMADVNAVVEAGIIRST